MDISDKELRELVEQARASLGEFFAKNEDEALAKSSDSDSSMSIPESGSSDSSDSSDSSSDSSSESSDSDSGSDSESMDLSDLEGSGSDSSSSDSSEDHSALEEGSVSLGDLKEAYAQLSDEELKLHYLAAREVLHERMEESSASGSSFSGEDSGSKSVESKDLQSLDDGATMKEEDMASEMSKAESSVDKAESCREGSGSISAEVSKARPAKEDVAKAEDRLSEMGKDSGPRSKDRMVEMEHGVKGMKKSEELATELESLKKSLEEQEKFVKLQAEIIEKLANPTRKAVTMADLAKSESDVDVSRLPREEVIKHLNGLSKSPDLKKSDRELIAKYCVGTVKADALSHLFKK